ncbi:E3 ubiquitin-protein ligase RNF220 [Aricia agestis]|uniref:E3 ubiquitin-protein ligase RNF220 n=1 Tax=Aricia agestis TaxID=91739 RepID=UPI001C20A980|nr:E3 ubiquitin-protein ligase RNF220 [Aricia agestis]
MLPAVMYNMEENSSGLNTSNSSFMSYDDSVILNSVRSRKKVSELPNCPVCSCTIRQGELDSHLALEVERLQKLSSGVGKRKLSASPGTSGAVAGSSSNVDTEGEPEVDVSGCLGSDVYQRIHANRLRRLRARRRSPPPQQGEGPCPVCNVTFPVSRLHRHALRCLKRTGAEMDEDVPDTSSEEGSIDVENDEPPESGFGSEYQWCGQWRVRATALTDGERPGVPVRRASTDCALVVDGDEDTELYGPPQYSPSRIAHDADIPPPQDEVEEDTSPMESDRVPEHKMNGLVEASAETRIQALKAKIKDLEKKQNSEAKCLICLGPYASPAVSIQCWHVYCEVCWLQSLRAKKICPQCNIITSAEHLRRIYM